MQPEIQYCARCNTLHAPGQHKARPKPNRDLNEESLAECIAQVRSGVDAQGRKITIKPTHIVLKAPPVQNRTKKPAEPKKPKAKERVQNARTAEKSPAVVSLVRPEVATCAASRPSSTPKDPKKMTRDELEALVAAVIAKENHKRKLKAKHQAAWRNRQKKERS